MGRQNFNDGQEILFSDLNTISSRIEKLMYDRVFLELLQRKKNSFFGDSFKVIFTGATAATVKKGIGFQEDLTVVQAEPVQRPLFRAADVNINFAAPDSSDDRIDIVVVKHSLVDGVTGSRKFKDNSTQVITNETLVLEKDWEAIINVITGTPAGSPVAPSVPAGFLKVGTALITASVGMANQSNITDNRSLLPFASSASPTAGEEWDSIVGDTAIIGVNQPDLKTALDNGAIGHKILVLRDEALTAIPQVNFAKMEIHFKRGVTFSKSGVTTGLKISANDCRIVGGRWLDFDTAGDEGIQVDGGVLRTVFEGGPRFNNCDTNIDDSGTDTYIPIDFTE